MMLSLNSFEKVKEFVNAITPIDAELNLVSGRYQVNAKSIMGIFNLDLSKPVELVTDKHFKSTGTEEERIAKVLQKFQAQA